MRSLRLGRMFWEWKESCEESMGWSGGQWSERREALFIYGRA